MDSSELAEKMLLWEKSKKELDSLEDEIKSAVLELKSTQKVGNVTATYSNGRRELDYQTSGQLAPVDIIQKNTTVNKVVDWDTVATLIDPEIIEECTHETASVNWSNVCKDAKIEPMVTKEGAPSVTIKLNK
jgi:ribosomal protein L29